MHIKLLKQLNIYHEFSTYNANYKRIFGSINKYNKRTIITLSKSDFTPH